MATNDRFIGRDAEFKLFDRYFHTPDSQLVVVYGRRRIGKSDFLKEYGKNKKKFYFEGLEKQRTKEQLLHFRVQLAEGLADQSINNVNFVNWNNAFQFLTARLTDNNPSQKKFIVFDEIQWMACGNDKLIALIKYYWDKYWKNQNIFLVLCGSVASFMINRVVRSNLHSAPEWCVNYRSYGV